MSYTKEEIKTLWDNLDLGIPFKDGMIYPVDLILVSIYTGIRPTELIKLENEHINLDELYIEIVDGKTGDRSIPIHDDIYPLVKKRKETGGKYFANLTMIQYMETFKKIMKQLNMVHSLHDARLTYFKQIKTPN